MNAASAVTLLPGRPDVAVLENLGSGLAPAAGNRQRSAILPISIGSLFPGTMQNDNEKTTGHLRQSRICSASPGRARIQCVPGQSPGTSLGVWSLRWPVCLFGRESSDHETSHRGPVQSGFAVVVSGTVIRHWSKKANTSGNAACTITICSTFGYSL